MPNQRDKNKKLFSIAIDKKVLAAVEEAARRMGLTRVEFLRIAAEEKLARDNKKQK